MQFLTTVPSLTLLCLLNPLVPPQEGNYYTFTRNPLDTRLWVEPPRVALTWGVHFQFSGHAFLPSTDHKNTTMANQMKNSNTMRYEKQAVWDFIVPGSS
jgi:hypothetical protein